MTIKQQIIEYLTNKDWCFAGKIEDYIREVDGHKASNASRRCRELVKEGKLERRLVRLDSVNVVQYRLSEKNSAKEEVKAKNLSYPAQNLGTLQENNQKALW